YRPSSRLSSRLPSVAWHSLRDFAAVNEVLEASLAGLLLGVALPGNEVLVEPPSMACPLPSLFGVTAAVLGRHSDAILATSAMSGNSAERMRVCLCGPNQREPFARPMTANACSHIRSKPAPFNNNQPKRLSH